MIWLLIAIAVGMIVVEKLWPAMELPRVRAWWGRVALINAIQIGIIILAGLTWNHWLAKWSLVRLDGRMADWAQGLIAYFISTFVYYWWHRIRHESRLWWLLCHQLHHSPRRIEILTSFYKHPVEITINSILSSAIVYLLLGCSIEAGAIYTFLTAVAEYIYHWNINTPRWIGFLFQRPESHRIIINLIITRRTSLICLSGTCSLARSRIQIVSRANVDLRNGAKIGLKTC